MQTFFKSERRAFCEKLSTLNESDIRASVCFIRIMSGDDDRRALLAQLMKKYPDVLAVNRIETDSRLVKKQE